VFLAQPLLLNEIVPKPEEGSVLNSLMFMMMYMKKHAFYRGKVENMLVVVDLGKAGPMSLPIGLMKPLKEVLSTLFKCHAARIILLGAHWTFSAAWKAISIVLDEAQKQKIVMCSNYDCPQLREMVSADQLLQKFGGTAKQPESWWPPNVPLTGVYTPKKVKVKATKAT